MSVQAETEKGVAQQLRSWFDRFVPLAFHGLERMLIDDKTRFCFKALDSGNGEVKLEGESFRYTAMSLLGLARMEQLGQSASYDTGRILDRLSEWGPTAELGNAGLVLWAQVLCGDPRAESLAKVIAARRDEELAPSKNNSSMEMGFLLIGLSEAMRAGLGGLGQLAADVAELLLRNRNEQTALFQFTRKVRRKNLHRARSDGRLGSFASNVYATMGLSAYHRATGNREALQAARSCAERICSLQGAEGQWWWVYQTHRPVPAVRYPVYTVHQDAMGHMMMLAASLADSNTTAYDEAMLKSWTWLDQRLECVGTELVDESGGMIWRAVQRDHPDVTGRLGLSRAEISRMGRVAWLGIEDKRPLYDGFVCPECRPYHLGWVLLAAAMLAERGA